MYWLQKFHFIISIDHAKMLFRNLHPSVVRWHINIRILSSEILKIMIFCRILNEMKIMKYKLNLEKCCVLIVEKNTFVNIILLKSLETVEFNAVFRSFYFNLDFKYFFPLWICKVISIFLWCINIRSFMYLICATFDRQEITLLIIKCHKVSTPLDQYTSEMKVRKEN